MNKDYIVIPSEDRFTIANWNESFKSLDEADGIYNHIFWQTEEAAQRACDALNAYEGKNNLEFIKEHL